MIDVLRKLPNTSITLLLSLFEILGHAVTRTESPEAVPNAFYYPGSKTGNKLSASSAVYRRIVQAGFKTMVSMR